MKSNLKYIMGLYFVVLLQHCDESNFFAKAEEIEIEQLIND